MMLRIFGVWTLLAVIAHLFILCYAIFFAPETFNGEKHSLEVVLFYLLGIGAGFALWLIFTKEDM